MISSKDSAVENDPTSIWEVLKQKQQIPYYATKKASIKKMKNYFFEILKKESFQNDINKIRISMIERYKEIKKIKSEKEIERFKDILFEEFISKIDTIRKRYFLPFEWRSMLADIVYGTVDKYYWERVVSQTNLLKVSDLRSEKVLEKALAENNLDASDDFPIFIKISPYASQRDIIDFIKKNYRYTIKPIQKTYADSKCKIGKFKTKRTKIQKRNEFIFENCELPLKKIAKLLPLNGFEILDEGHISKIISLESKRRKDM